MVLASSDGALLWPFALVGKHVSLEILRLTAAFWKRAETLLLGLIVELVAAATIATSP
jgi:hypothetical protein